MTYAYLNHSYQPNDPLKRREFHINIFTSDNIGIKDNDSLAAKVAVEIGADLAILMSDVDGIYNKPPNEDGARIMHTFLPSDLNNIKFGAASSVGTGGMESKVKSALWALERGTSVVICNGMEYNTIRKIYNGSRTGSFFTNAEDEGIPVEVMAQNGKYFEMILHLH